MQSFLKSKKALLASLVFAGLASNAQAATVDLSGSASSTGFFTKEYTFSIASGYVADLTGFFTSGVDALDGDNYGFSIAGVTLQGAAINEKTSFVYDLIDPSWIAITYTNKFSATNLTSGNYTLKLNGTSFSADSNFTGAYVLNTLPVPEPESYALMMLGLGLIGLIVNRKNS